MSKETEFNEGNFNNLLDFSELKCSLCGNVGNYTDITKQLNEYHMLCECGHYQEI